MTTETTSSEGIHYYTVRKLTLYKVVNGNAPSHTIDPFLSRRRRPALQLEKSLAFFSGPVGIGFPSLNGVRLVLQCYLLMAISAYLLSGVVACGVARHGRRADSIVGSSFGFLLEAFRRLL